MNSPPLLVSFYGLEQYLTALPIAARTEFESQIRRLVEMGLPPVVSARCLGVLFGFSGEIIGAMMRRTMRYYRHFVIPKGRGKRHIYAPRVALKVIQKWFGYHLASAIKFDPCVHGFVKGRSAVQAAMKHCAATWVFSADIQDFFPSTLKAIVESAIESLGYPQHGAKLMTALCCYGDGLAQGSPASPVLSNLVFRQADKELTQLACDFGARYTRYADDIVFSGTAEVPAQLDVKVIQIIECHGWKIAPKKQWLARLPNRLRVHGLLVHGDVPRLTKGYRNRIRAFKHLMAAGRVSDKDIQKIKGHLAYAKSVDAFNHG